LLMTVSFSNLSKTESAQNEPKTTDLETSEGS